MAKKEKTSYIGVNNSQSHGILNPLIAAAPQHSDESRLKLLAQQYLDKKTIEKLKLT